MYRIWSHGRVMDAGAAALRKLRAAVLECEGTSRDHLRIVDPDPGNVKGRPRCAFTAWWHDKGTGAEVHSLYVVDLVQPDRATWSVMAVSDKRWTHNMLPPGERPSVVDVLRTAGIADDFADPSGLPMMNTFLYRHRGIGYDKEHGKQVARGIQSKARTTAVLIISEKACVEYPSWWGVMTTLLVRETTLRDINEALPPSRAIPPGGGRLFAAGLTSQADQVFDADAVVQNPVVMAALQQVYSLRQQTPPPAAVIEDATIAEWWTSHPADLLLEQQRATMQAQAAELQQDLEAERRRVAILTGQREKMQRERDAIREENERLQEKLAALASADPETAAAVAQLRAQLATAHEELDRYEATLEEVEAERDDLAWVRFVLARAVAQLESNDRVEAEFDQILDESSLSSPLAQALQALTPAWVYRRLQARLNAGDQTARGEGRDTGRPEFASFPELLAHAGKVLPGIVITADPDLAAGLDHHPKAAAWRRKSWDALATLNAYVEQRRAAADGDREPGPWSKDVLSYIKAGEPGALVSANIVSLGESEGVRANERFRQARTFPVPVEVDETGKAVFIAHVGIERFKAPAPRLYFLDDVSGTGVVYVGYLGPHLPTTRTN